MYGDSATVVAVHVVTFLQSILLIALFGFVHFGFFFFFLQGEEYVPPPWV